MERKMVAIDEEKCNGCGLCISACHEGALQLVNGKAKLISDSYCDGLGACLPECPTGAIQIRVREALVFDEKAVEKLMEGKNKSVPEKLACGCPGTQARKIDKSQTSVVEHKPAGFQESQLGQWPVQIKLVPVNAPYFENANLLIAADCTAYAYSDFHNSFMRNKITLIGCPKLDEIDYSNKLTEILKLHEIKSVTVVRMEVPCCGGIVSTVKKSLQDSGKMVPWRVITIGTDGSVIDS